MSKATVIPAKATPVPRQPASDKQVLDALRQFPNGATLEELVAANPEWYPTVTYNRLFRLRGDTADGRNVHLDHSTGRYYIEGVA